MMKLIYTRRYNIGFLGLERLHPFDSRKYGRAWRAIGSVGRLLRDRALVGVPRPVSVAELSVTHDPSYLARLGDPRELAWVLELPFLRRLPAWAVWRAVLRPMRWAVAGSLVAAREALTHGLALNLSGGYHHARPNGGEGFCVFNDIAHLVHGLRTAGRLAPDDRVVYVDLDAHQGNGVCHHFRSDPRVFLYDAFNPHIYPAHDQEARRRIDCAVPLPDHCTGGEYMRLLNLTLPGFLDSVCRSGRVGLAVYNAGTDVFAGDTLGGLNLTAADVLARDLYVIEQLRGRVVPTVMLLSGGYSRESYRLVANTAVELLRRYPTGRGAG
ncbi:histone deacetylase [Gemmata obscuriglobus]|uniref:Histone deacetylase n=2 Tax=Gemmata obscuriglobus TaxID=114 RepID=A0A2Z3GU57_9BACT|nr:histone deacetylase [Gemmata obscuriglobus]